MSKRVTILIDDDLDKLLRIAQARMIEKTQEFYSYSNTLNDKLRKVLLK